MLRVPERVVLAQRLRSLEPLRQLSGLRQLCLAGNRLEEVSDLAACVLLETLILDRNLLVQVPEDLAALTKLRILSLRDNRIVLLSSFAPLAMLAGLVELNVQGNPAALLVTNVQGFLFGLAPSLSTLDGCPRPLVKPFSQSVCGGDSLADAVFGHAPCTPLWTSNAETGEAAGMEATQLMSPSEALHSARNLLDVDPRAAGRSERDAGGRPLQTMGHSVVASAQVWYLEVGGGLCMTPTPSRNTVIRLVPDDEGSLLGSNVGHPAACLPCDGGVAVRSLPHIGAANQEIETADHSGHMQILECSPIGAGSEAGDVDVGAAAAREVHDMSSETGAASAAEACVLALAPVFAMMRPPFQEALDAAHARTISSEQVAPLRLATLLP